MIFSFADKDTESIYNEKRPRKLKLQPYLLRKALDKLRMMDAAETFMISIILRQIDLRL